MKYSTRITRKQRSESIAYSASYIPIDVFAKVLEKAPNATWRSLLVLARLGALRIPSEAQGLKWDHIAWEAKRISIIASSKSWRNAMAEAVAESESFRSDGLRQESS
jgi:hypothetical protein